MRFVWNSKILKSVQYASANQPILLTAFQVNERQHIIREVSWQILFLNQEYSFTYFPPKSNVSSYKKLINE